MPTKLTIRNFKRFEHVEIELGNVENQPPKAWDHFYSLLEANPDL